jgi:hypothetical protein
MIKNYHIKFDWWEASIQIDDSPATIEAMKEQLLFWTGGQTLIDDYDGDVTHAYIRQTAPIIIDLSRNKNTYGIIHELKNMEGFLPIAWDVTGNSAVIRKIRTTYKQPMARSGFRRGQRK